MTKIKDIISNIKDEVCGACIYAEDYVIYKNTHPTWAAAYHEMALQELSHIEHLRKIGQEKIDSFSYVPENDKLKWENFQRKMADHIAEAKVMLSK